MNKHLAWIAGVSMALAVGCAGSQKPHQTTPTANPSDPTQPPPGDSSATPPPANPCQPRPK